jgi:glucokinase
VDFRASDGDSPPLAVSGTVVAVDVGGTVIKGARLDVGFDEQSRVEVATPAPGDAGALLAAVAHVVDELRDGTVVAAGVAVAGNVDSDTGTVNYAGNLGLSDLPLRALLVSRLALPVSVEQDGRAAALAELHRGAAVGHADAVVIAIGTGIAAGLITRGDVVRGATFRAGELGHVPVVPGGEPCVCGMRGCAEAYAGGASMARRYYEATGRRTSAERVFAAARTADPDAERVLGAAVDALAAIIVGCIVSLDPAVVLIGGGVSRAGAQLLDPLRARVNEALTWREAPPIGPTGCGPDAALVGAALVARDAVATAIAVATP